MIDLENERRKREQSELKQKHLDAGERVVLCCTNCNCQTHYHHEDGTIECGYCGAFMDNVGGQWRAGFKEPQFPLEEAEGGVVRATTIDELGGYRVLRVGQEAMEADSLSFVLVVMGSGQVHQWQNTETEWQKDWLVKKLDISRKLIKHQKIEKDDL